MAPEMSLEEFDESEDVVMDSRDEIEDTPEEEPGGEAQPTFDIAEEEPTDQDTPDQAPEEKVEGVKEKYAGDPEKLAQAHANLQLLYGRQTQEVAESREEVKPKQQEIADDATLLDLEGKDLANFIESAVDRSLERQKSMWAEEQQQVAQRNEVANFMVKHDLSMPAMDKLAGYMVKFNIRNFDKAYKLAVMENVLPGKGKPGGAKPLKEFPTQTGTTAGGGAPVSSGTLKDQIDNWDKLPDEKRLEIMKQLG